MKRKTDRTRLIAALATGAVTALVTVWMVLCAVTVDSTRREWPPEHKADISVDNEEFVELYDMVSASLDESARAYDPVEESNLSDASEQSGTETVDEGERGEAATPVTTGRQSPVQIPERPQPSKSGPAEDARKKEEEQARRRARAATIGAFKGAGQNNTTNPTGSTRGNSGSPSGAASAVNGRLNGRAGSGWGLPGYGLITSPVTGTVKVKVTILPDGSVPAGGVEFIGGTPPAATNPTTKANIEREIRSKRFHRSDNLAPETATAIITVTF